MWVSRPMQCESKKTKDVRHQIVTQEFMPMEIQLLPAGGGDNQHRPRLSHRFSRSFLYTCVMCSGHVPGCSPSILMSGQWVNQRQKSSWRWEGGLVLLRFLISNVVLDIFEPWGFPCSCISVSIYKQEQAASQDQVSGLNGDLKSPQGKERSFESNMDTK